MSLHGLLDDPIKRRRREEKEKEEVWIKTVHSMQTVKLVTDIDRKARQLLAGEGFIMCFLKQKLEQCESHIIDEDIKENKEPELVSSGCSQAINKNILVTAIIINLLNKINSIFSTSDANANLNVFLAEDLSSDENCSDLVVKVSKESFEEKDNTEYVESRE
ncbi:hypothetical protein HZH68_013239 [Vespula germanica]|uniref:Uncharacterized protein n=1 Tax=Vespula germanica TaxID=30212 RepID=A0A834JDX1_VESGE|nr:hypothetical protein HZH68_013239 [Vespula germanica]